MEEVQLTVEIGLKLEATSYWGYWEEADSAKSTKESTPSS
jgi:hypothetical protein